MSTVLDLQHVRKSFGGLQALRDVSLQIDSREIVGLIGPNGAGKTTLINAMSGLCKPDSGKIILCGAHIEGKSPEVIARAGIARTFQNIRLFEGLSVIDHLHVPRGTQPIRDDDIAEILDLLELDTLQKRCATDLPYGIQRHVEIARALALFPRVLLLDEPAAGLSSAEAMWLAEKIRAIVQTKEIALIVVEHNLQLVMELADRMVCMDQGAVLVEGEPDFVRAHPAVISVYLGSHTHSGEKQSESYATRSHTPRSSTAKRVIEVQNLTVSYDGIDAVRGVSFNVDEGEIFAVLGANGAGKSSMLKGLMGLVDADGTRRFLGEDLTDEKTHQIARRGVAYVPEGRGIWGELSVRENLELGFFGAHKGMLKDILERTLTLFPRLQERISQKAGTLSGGEQQMLALGRAWMSSPKILLLDEPSLGLGPRVVREVFDAIFTMSQTGTTIVLIEQNTRLALDIAHRAIVLSLGEVTLRGSAKELQSAKEVEAAYLGSA